MASLALAGGGAIFFDASPASAASSTDSIYVNDYPTSLVEPLPAGTPDVATPLVNAITDICSLPLPTYEVPQLTLGEVLVCYSPYNIPINETIVAGTPNVGVMLPADGFGPPPGCGVALCDFPVKGGDTAEVGLAPPGVEC